MTNSNDWAFSGSQASFLHALIQNNPLAVVVLDENHRVQMCNPAFERMFLFRQEDIQGASLDELVATEETLEEANGLTRDILAGHAVSRSTIRRRRDGSLIDVEVHGLPLVAEGKVVGAYGLYQDITERKRAVEALRASEERYRRLFEKNLAGVYRTTVDGRILDCNEAFARIFGYSSREEILQHRASDLHPSPATRERTTTRLLEKGSLNNYENCLRRKDGSPVWVLQNVSLFRGENGAPDVSEGTIIDITERKQAELSLRRLSGRLLRLQDEERRRMARELHDMIAQSLAAVTMYLSVIKQSEGLLDLPARQALTESIALAEECSREIRTFSYLLHPPLLDEVGLLSTLRWYAIGFSQRSGIRVRLDLPEVLGRLSRAVETTLFRIVQEGLTNIHRHSGSSTAGIRLVRDEGVITLEVSDKGKGISSRVLDQRDGGVAELGVGITGMRERMKQLEGYLEIKSGKTGTTVRAILPVDREEVGVEDTHPGGRRSRSRPSRAAGASRGADGLGGVRRGWKRP